MCVKPLGHGLVQFQLAQVSHSIRNWNGIDNFNSFSLYHILCSVIDCSDPGTPPNSERRLTATTFGSKVTYTCLSGHTLRGISERTCLANGRWSNSPPQCVPSDCGEPEPLTNGNVDYSSSSIGSTAVYRCNQGYRFRGTNSAICQSNGKWSGTVRECVCESNEKRKQL